MRRAVVRSIFRFLFRVLTRLDAQGVENFPAQGGAILASNHVGILDAPLVFTLIERQDATGLVADKYKKKIFFRILIGAVDGIWLNRDAADLPAIRQAREYLKRGGLLGIAPEGTRSCTGALIPAKTGVAYLADKAEAPIVPIAVSGSEKAVSSWLHLRRVPIKVRIGTPFDLAPLDRKDRDGSLQRNTDEIMCRIAVMLPPAYWGVYADHPRLRELLAGQVHPL